MGEINKNTSEKALVYTLAWSSCSSFLQKFWGKKYKKVLGPKVRE